MNVSATTSLALGTARPGLAILWGGLICGTMDITAAITVYGQFGLKPVPLLQGIAAGLLGAGFLFMTARLWSLARIGLATGREAMRVFSYSITITILRFTI